MGAFQTRWGAHTSASALLLVDVCGTKSFFHGGTFFRTGFVFTFLTSWKYCVCVCECVWQCVTLDSATRWRSEHPTASGRREAGLDLSYSLYVLLDLRRSVSNRSCFRNRPGLCGDTHLSAKPADDVAATGPAHRQEPCGRRPERFWT